MKFCQADWPETRPVLKSRYWKEDYRELKEVNADETSAECRPPKSYHPFLSISSDFFSLFPKVGITSWGVGGRRLAAEIYPSWKLQLRPQKDIRAGIFIKVRRNRNSCEKSKAKSSLRNLVSPELLRLD